MSREAGQKRFRDPRLRRGFGGRNRCGGNCNRLKIILQPEPLAGRRLTAICHRCCHLSTVLLINAPEIRFSASHSFQIAFLCVFSFYIMTSTQARQENPSVRVIMIGAHPDDCELKGGGTAAIFSGMGYAVKFVSVTNGDAGHQSERGSQRPVKRESVWALLMMCLITTMDSCNRRSMSGFNSSVRFGRGRQTS